MDHHFIRDVKETISQFNMIRGKETILVGVSGGPDSIALVRVLMDLQKTHNIDTPHNYNIGIAHLNHGLRGEESIRDEIFVRNLAQDFNLPFFLKKMDIHAKATDEQLSIEEAGRNARYKFFKDTAKIYGFAKIATGHNQDDNAELVLMNILRGSGVRGLCGIPPMRGNKFIRPLIQMPKSRILAFLKEKHQDFVVDSSNTDQSYVRNKIRHSLIPILEQNFNPETKSCLDRLSHILGIEDDYLTGQADQIFHACTIKKDKTLIALSIKELTSNHPALVNRVLRQAIAWVKKDLKRITLTHIQDILILTRAESGKSLDMPGRIRVYKNRDMLYFKKESLSLRELGKNQKQLQMDIKKKSGEKPENFSLYSLYIQILCLYIIP